MALDKCIESVQAAIGGRELSSEERNLVQKHAARFLRASERGADVDKMLAEFGDEMKARAAISKRNTAKNISWAKENDDFRRNNPAWAGNPWDSLRAMLPGSLSSRLRSKDSLGSLVSGAVEGAKAELYTDLDKAGLTKYLASGADNKNLHMAIVALQHGEDAAKFGKNAASAAKIFVEHNRARLAEYNTEGGWIPENPDRVTRNSHDPGKIRAAGEAQWAADQHDLDWDRAFHGEYASATASQRRALLSSQFQQLGNGYHLQYHPPEGPTKGFANIAARRAHSREYVYKTPEGEFNYQQKYGIGNNLTDRITTDIGSLARDTAIMRKLGPNAEGNVKAFVDRWAKELTEKGRGADAKLLLDEHQRIMDKFWPIVAGDPMSVHGSLARFSQSVKAAQGLSHLGKVVLRQIGDMVTSSQILNHFGARTPGGYMGKSYTLLMHMLGTMTDKEAGMAWAARNHILLDDIHRPVNYANALEQNGYGKIAQAERWALRSGGSMGWVNRMRRSSAAEIAHDHYTLRGKSYDQIGEGYREGLKQYGITSEGWDIIRKTKPDDLGKGGYMALDGAEILKTDPERFRPLATTDNPTAAHLTKQRQALYDRYTNMISDIGNLAVNHASPTVRSIAYQGTHAGTPVGEGLRQAATFKMWTISFMRNFLGRELHGYAEGRYSPGEAMQRMLTLKDGGRGMTGLGTLIASGLFWGHISNMLGDVASGITPQNPFDPEQAKDAMARAFMTSSSAGLYGDFVLGQGRTVADKAWEMASGPAISSAGHALDAAFDAYRGLGKDNTDEAELKALDKLLRAGQEQLPFRNFLYTKAAADYFVFDPLSEALNPGWKQRKADRLAKRGQSLILGQQP